MSLVKGIGSLIVTIVAITSLLGYLAFATDMFQGASRLSQGDASAANDMAQTTADFVIDEVTWSAGISVAIAICSALGLGFLAKILRSC